MANDEEPDYDVAVAVAVAVRLLVLRRVPFASSSPSSPRSFSSYSSSETIGFYLQQAGNDEEKSIYMPTRQQTWRTLRRAGSLGERFISATTSQRSAKAAASTDKDDENRGRKVAFSYRVTVVLVPSTDDLRPFSAQLWWGAEDYLDFR